MKYIIQLKKIKEIDKKVERKRWWNNGYASYTFENTSLVLNNFDEEFLKALIK